MSAKIETLRPDHVALVGYVDDLREDRVYGWAWDRRAPGQRIEIQVWLGDRPVATALADRARADLRNNGVGDGQHAFEIALPEATAETVTLPVRVFAKAPGGDLIELERRPPPAEASPPIDAALRRIFDELERVRSAQRVLGKAAHATLGDLRKLSGSTEAARPAAPDGAIEELRGTHAAVLGRLGDIEAVLMRIDGSLADLAGRIDGATGAGERVRIPSWLYAAFGAGAAVIVAALVLLGWAR